MVEQLVIVTDYADPPGGASMVAVWTARMFAEAGTRVRFLAGVGPVHPDLVHPAITVECLSSRDLLAGREDPAVWVNGLWNRGAARALRSLLDGLDPKRVPVHVHQIHKCLSGSVVSAAKRLGFRVVYHCHDYYLACPNGGHYDFQLQRPCALRPMGVRCLATGCDRRSGAHKLWRVGRNAIERAAGVVGQCDAMVAVSRLSARRLRWMLPRGPRLHVLDNPVGMDDQGPCRPETSRHFLFVGRTVIEKGIVDAVEACASAGVELDVVGDGPLGPKQLGGDHVTWHGWGDADTVRRVMRRSRALVFPSRIPETQGLVVIESMANGLPVVTSSNAGSSDYVRRFRAGLLTPPGDPLAIAAAISRLRDDDRLVATAGMRGYRGIWSSSMRPEAYRAALGAIYASVLGGGR